MLVTRNTCEMKSPCDIIVRRVNGRFGNHIYMFATAYGISRIRSCKLYVDFTILQELNQTFEIHLPNMLLPDELSKTTPVEVIKNRCTFLPHILYSNYTNSIELTGYWQVQKYFIDYTEEIRQQLIFKKKIMDQVKTFFEQNVSHHSSVSVGVHIRRGDFVSLNKASSDKYIFSAMSYMEKKYRSVTFLIVSDDKEYCRKTFIQNRTVFITPDSFSAAEDMAVLTLCTHIILTGGTFGWWAAFLLRNRDGEVLTDSKPNHAPVDVTCDGDNYFPPWFTFLNYTR